MADQTLDLNEEQLKSLSQLLLAAAWADNELHGLETDAIDRILKQLVHPGLLPEQVTQYIESFDPAGFDIAQAVATLGLEDVEQRRAVLGLIATVIDSDFTYDFQEGDYLKQVAAALGASQEDYTNHLVRTVRLRAVSPTK